MHTWTTVNAGRMLMLNANGSYAVKVAADARGFLWIAGRKHGYAATLAAAKDWTEALFENDQLPGPMRAVHTGNRNPG